MFTNEILVESGSLGDHECCWPSQIETVNSSDRKRQRQTQRETASPTRFATQRSRVLDGNAGGPSNSEFDAKMRKNNRTWHLARFASYASAPNWASYNEDYHVNRGTRFTLYEKFVDLWHCTVHTAIQTILPNWPVADDAAIVRVANSTPADSLGRLPGRDDSIIITPLAASTLDARIAVVPLDAAALNRYR
jgi:hypothetical protein